MKCFYHADADGICAGYWVWESLLNPKKEDFIKINYDIKFPFELIQADEEVWIVDYSIEPDEMRKLLSVTKNVIWIDHHKTAIDKYKDFEYHIEGIRLDGIAGCMLTYMHVLGRNSTIPVLQIVEKAPWFTKYIADYDVWKFEYGEKTKLFQIAFTAHNFEPWSKEWEKFYEGAWGYEYELIQAGREMLKYRDGWAASVMEVGFETDFEGYKCFAVNLPRCNSQFFDSVGGTDAYDILMPFYWNGQIWSVSLYSSSVDVSEIAKKYAGGGHKGASGFQVKELPFRRNE